MGPLAFGLHIFCSNIAAACFDTFRWPELNYGYAGYESIRSYYHGF